jgi:uncharacterized repeat protein (TIGR02543 family)
MCFRQVEHVNAPGQARTAQQGLTPRARPRSTSRACGGTPPNGQTLVLDQANDSSDTGGVYICDGSVANCNGEGPGSYVGRTISGKVHTETQVTHITGVTSIGGGAYTVTISPGLYFNNVRTSQAPGVWWNGFTQFMGLENLTIDRTGFFNSDSNVAINNADKVWMKNVRSMWAGRNHVWVYLSSNAVIRDSYFYQDQSHASESYGIEMTQASGVLIENNIFQQVSVPYDVRAGIGNRRCLQPRHQQRISRAESGSRERFALCRKPDESLGRKHSARNSIRCFMGRLAATGTWYRNFLTGWQQGYNQYTYPVSMSTHNRAFNVVGNVLGQPAYQTSYEGYATSTTGGTNGGNAVNTTIYNLGWTGYAGWGGCDTNGGTTGCDSLVRPTLMRWANWDVVTNATKFDSTEAAPGAVAYVAANFSSSYFSTLSHALPDSLFYSSTPSWWPSGKAWPPVGPDVSGGNVGRCASGTYTGAQATISGQCTGGTLSTAWASHVTSIPAQDCYLNTLGGAPDGTGSVLAFNASVCYSVIPPTTFNLVTTAANGSVSGTNCASSTYASGTSIGPCSATPNTGYTFTGWSGSGSCSSVSGTGTASCALTSNSTLTATFTINTFTWTKTIVGSGTVTGTNNASGTYNYGSTIGPLSATPGTGFSFVGWSAISGNAACFGTTNPCPLFTLTSNSTATATFSVNSYTLSTATAGTGSGSISGCSGAHNYNTSYSCTVTPSAGSVLASVAGCGGSGTTTFAGTMPASNCTVTATFNINSFALSISTSGSGAGTISGTNCTSGTYPSGTAIGPCTASATSGVFAGWTGTGSALSCTGTGPCSFTITATSTLNAAFSTTQTPTPNFSPVAATYGTAQTVTISDSLGNANVQITTNEGSNANASNGDAPSRNLYTNCATSCSGGVPQPANSGIVSHGQLWCNSSQVTSCGTFGSGFVTSTITGTGVHSLDNGRGAGGDDSATSMTSIYGGATANPCAAVMGGSTGWAGLNFPSAVPNSHTTYVITTGSSNFNTSLLAPTKNTMTTALGDAIDHYLTSSCMDISNTTAGGVHAEFDTNHNTSTHQYFGFGKHFNFATKKFYFCPQGCSGWKEMDLRESNGTLHTTFNWPINHAMYIVTFDHRDPGCTSTSGSNCMWYDYACVQDVTAGTAKVCGNWIDPLTGKAPGGIPELKSSFTPNETNTQTQIDINAANTTITQNVWRTFVGYNLSGTNIYYTNDGSTPTTASTPYVLPISVATSQTIKAVAITSGHTLSAVGTAAYVISPSLTLSVNSSGTGSGTISGTNCATNTYPSGTAVTCNASATTGSTFTGWSGGTCTGTGTCSFTLTSNSVVTANFSLNTYTFGVSRVGTGSGTTSGTNCANGTYNFGTSISCAASATTGSTFTGWSGTGSASSCSGTGGCVFTLGSNSTATATFAINTFTLTTSTAGSGSGSLSGSNCTTGTYNFGTAVTCTPSPDPGSTFTGWSGACTGTGACSFTMNANKTITATFSSTFNLTVSTAGTGSGSVLGASCVTGTYTTGTSVSCSTSANPGSTFTGWSGTGSASTCSGTGACVFALSADSTLTATFNAVTFTFGISTSGTGSGTTSGTNCSNSTYGTGTSISCSASPAGGSTFTGWTGTGSASPCTGGTLGCPFTLTSNSTLSAVFTGTVAVVGFSPTGNTYSTTQLVTLSSATGSAMICYTLDGSTPTAIAGSCTHGISYSTTISVSTSQTITAVASKSGYTNSSVTSATYTIVGPSPPSNLLGDVTLVSLSLQ